MHGQRALRLVWLDTIIGKNEKTCTLKNVIWLYYNTVNYKSRRIL